MSTRTLQLATCIVLAWTGISGSLAADKYAAYAADGNEVWLKPAKSTELQAKPVPDDVAALIDKLLKQNYETLRANYKPENPDDFTLRDFQAKTYVLATPFKAELFAIRIDGPFGISRAYFVLRSKTGSAPLSSPAVVDMHWLDGFREENSELLSAPYISFDRIGSGSSPDLVVESYGHNGTEYNASVYVYFRVAADLSLTQELVLEKRMDLPMEIAGFKSPWVERTLVSVGLGQLKVNVTLRDWDDPKNSAPIGSFELKKRTANGSYHIVSQSVTRDGIPAEALVTGEEIDPDEFTSGKGDLGP